MRDKGVRLCVSACVRLCVRLCVRECVGVLSWGFLWKCTVLSLVEFQQGHL